MKPDVSRVVSMGDSLSDRDTLAKRYLFGVISLGWLTGLNAHSPLGRFTNGLVWTDYFSSMLAEDFLIHKESDKDASAHQTVDFDAADEADDILTGDHKNHRIPKDKLEPSEIGDAILDLDPRIKGLLAHNYFLNDDRAIRYEGQEFVRTYDEGGLTAHDYSWSLSASPTLLAIRRIVSHLSLKREQLLADDQKHEITMTQKARSLVMELSGANDLFEANARPSREAADLAVKARVRNAELLMKNGYRNFALFNLPDLSLTPYFQAKCKEDQENARTCSAYFNEKLKAEIESLRELYPFCTFEVFDLSSKFTDIYDHPENYRIDPAKQKIPYITSKDFKIEANHTSPAPGYMFWDIVHPTTAVHDTLARWAYEEVSKKFKFSAPSPLTKNEPILFVSETALCAAFKKKYNIEREQQRHGYFAMFVSKTPELQKEMTLKEILNRALYKNDQFVRHILIDLQWIDAAGKIKLNIPLLQGAKEALDMDHATEYGYAN